jgi:hypothetical protein
VFGEAAEPSALNQPGNTHRRAAAALNVASSFGGDGIVCLEPDRAGTDCHRALRRVRCLAALRNEILSHRDIVHVARPYQQRVGRIGRALIAVASAFDDETQVVFLGEVHCGGDVIGISRSDCIDAWFGRPAINPAQCLRQPGAVTDVVRILKIGRDALQSAPSDEDRHALIGKSTGIRFPPT